MTDLEITKRCAEAYFAGRLSHGPQITQTAVGRTYVEPDDEVKAILYNPLHDDPQAMALVKKMELWIQPPRQGYLSRQPSDIWLVAHSAKGGDSRNLDLNRAICECVAKMKGQK